MSEKIQRGQHKNAHQSEKQQRQHAAGLCCPRQAACHCPDDRIAGASVELQDKEDTTLLDMQKQLQDCEKGIENMLDAIRQGVLTPKTKERPEAQQEELKAAILQTQIQQPRYKKE